MLKIIGFKKAFIEKWNSKCMVTEQRNFTVYLLYLYPSMYILLIPLYLHLFYVIKLLHTWKIKNKAKKIRALRSFNSVSVTKAIPNRCTGKVW